MSTLKIALSAVAFTLVSGAAMAQEAVPAQWNSAYTPDVSVSHSGKSRAEVVADMLSARRSGELSRYDNDSYSPVQLPGTRIAAKQTMPAGTDGALTRAEVRAEFLAARRSGEVNAFDADPYVNVPGPVAAAAPVATTVAAR